MFLSALKLFAFLSFFVSSPHEVASIDRVAQWIRRPTSNRKIVGSIPIVVVIDNRGTMQRSKKRIC